MYEQCGNAAIVAEKFGVSLTSMYKWIKKAGKATGELTAP